MAASALLQKGLCWRLTSASGNHCGKICCSEQLEPEVPRCLPSTRATSGPRGAKQTLDPVGIHGVNVGAGNYKQIAGGSVKPQVQRRSNIDSCGRMCTMLAPNESAICTVESVEPESTKMISTSRQV